MNKFFLTCLLPLLFSPAYSQNNFALKLFVEDAVGRKDTITFGVNDTTTLGIDSSMGEVNIFGTPFDSLDIRVIQRDSINFHCNSFLSNLYFPQNIDSKIDFRPYNYPWTLNNNFEIFISGFDYPIIVRSDFSEIQFHIQEYYSSIRLFNNDCNSIDDRTIYYDPSSDSLFTLTDSSLNTLIVNLENEVGIDQANSMDDLLTIYPNPVNERLNIKFNNVTFTDPTFTVYNLFGQEIITAPLLQNEINLPQLKAGVYYLEITDAKKTMRQTFIKQ